MIRYFEHLIPRDARDYLAIGSVAVFTAGAGIAQYGIATTPRLSFEEKQQITLERAIEITPNSTKYGLGLAGLGTFGIFASIAPWPRREEVYAILHSSRVSDSYNAASVSK